MVDPFREFDSEFKWFSIAFVTIAVLGVISTVVFIWAIIALVTHYT